MFEETNVMVVDILNFHTKKLQYLPNNATMSTTYDNKLNTEIAR